LMVGCSGTAWTLNVESIGCAETSVTTYQPTRRNIPEETRSQLHRGGSLKSCMLALVWPRTKHWEHFVKCQIQTSIKKINIYFTCFVRCSFWAKWWHWTG
jgi:hypothetical protein